MSAVKIVTVTDLKVAYDNNAKLGTHSLGQTLLGLTRQKRTMAYD